MPVEFSTVVGRKAASFLFLLLEEAGQMDEPLPAASGGGSVCFVMSEAPLSTGCPGGPGQMAPFY